jgi:hypothetical protein
MPIDLLALAAFGFIYPRFAYMPQKARLACYGAGCLCLVIAFYKSSMLSSFNPSFNLPSSSQSQPYQRQQPYQLDYQYQPSQSH